MSVPDQVSAAGAHSQSSLRAFFGEASPSSVFSAPMRQGDDLILTAAAWERAGGFGFGGGTGDEGGGGGGGGGGAAQGRPVAVIRVTPTGTEVTPLFDVTKITVTVLLSAVGVWKALH